MPLVRAALAFTMFGFGCKDDVDVPAGGEPAGLDPAADADGDGLTNGRELEIGTDPHNVDTDGDGYSDRDEDFEGVDPLDPDDVIYQGGWPYYFAKAGLSGGRTFGVGKRFGDFAFKDQHGDLVHLWDFHNADTYVMIAVCDGQLVPCREMSAWLGGYATSQSYAEFRAVRDAVDAEALYWIVLLYGDGAGEPASEQDAGQWANDYPHPLIPVLADGSYEIPTYVDLAIAPTLLLLEPDLEVHTTTPPNLPDVEGDGYLAVLAAAVDVLTP